MKYSLSLIIKKAAVYCILVMFLILMIFPFIYLVSLALQTAEEATSLPPTIFPSSIQLKNFINVLDKAPLFLFLRNSLVYSVVATFLVTICAVLSAYAITKISFPGRGIFTIFFISTILVPPGIRVVPLYGVIADLGWVNSWPGLILPLAATGFTIHFMRQYFITIPKDIIEAARIDGASELQIVSRVIVPISKPAIGTIIIFNFIFRWNEYLWPLVVTKADHRTLTVGLASLKTSQNYIPWNEIAAGAMLLFIPSLVIFLVLRRYLMERGTVSREGIFR